MINVSKLKKGIIIDHIESGHGFEIYKELHLNEIDDAVSYTHLTLPTKLEV